MTDTALDALAAALGPAVVAPAAEAWKLPFPLPDDDVVVWGRVPDEAPLGLLDQARGAASRELRLARLRAAPPSPYEVRGVHRLPPRRLRGGLAGLRRKLLRAGVAVELARPGAPARALDLAVSAAGATTTDGILLVTGGVVLALVTIDGRHAVLRAVPQARVTELDQSAAALARLDAVDLVPRLLGRGTTAGLAWSAETRLPGRRPLALPPTLLDAAAAFLATLPRGPAGPPAVADDLATLGRLLDLETPLADVADRTLERLEPLPAVVRHGDFWLGNLLLDDGTLTGVVDWDSWHPAGVPGTDLLHLLATEERTRRRRSLGQVWLDRPWEAPTFAASRYWDVLGVHPDRRQRAAIGVAWWAGQLTGDLQRNPSLQTERQWRLDNVDCVLAALRAET